MPCIVDAGNIAGGLNWLHREKKIHFGKVSETKKHNTWKKMSTCRNNCCSILTKVNCFFFSGFALHFEDQKLVKAKRPMPEFRDGATSLPNRRDKISRQWRFSRWTSFLVFTPGQTMKLSCSWERRVQDFNPMWVPSPWTSTSLVA